MLKHSEASSNAGCHCQGLAYSGSGQLGGRFAPPCWPLGQSDHDGSHWPTNESPKWKALLHISDGVLTRPTKTSQAMGRRANGHVAFFCFHFLHASHTVADVLSLAGPSLPPQLAGHGQRMHARIPLPRSASTSSCFSRRAGPWRRTGAQTVVCRLAARQRSRRPTSCNRRDAE